MQTIFCHTLSDTLYKGTIPVLSYQIRYPSFQSTCSRAAARQINMYYRAAAQKAEAYCHTELYAQAVETAQYMPEGAFPGFEWRSDFHVTWNKGCVVSLFTDQYSYMGGAHGSTVRTSDTWDFRTGMKLALPDILPSYLIPQQKPGTGKSVPASVLEILFSTIERQIAKRLTASPGSYFEEYPQFLRQTFRAESFYLTPEGLVIYYQQYDIAPYANGIPEFFFPF